ncbi:uncharacterized protein FOMMEDRAFT_168971 [Fomitiporia mediterranea MF3/22]|uniref:uncharacterized protein n=1 Tax=Fomitiporia mediterranea (strain MF3/22) TaxID=694068 RepID=UPI0004409863|nr:uncharacterized protein FOMMEDRAFT_168971 [Fomitiporia mediterranea MF3/22]EJD02548.1 hypothetical protein FOMMEDRAFT_168971 [Fomitiporia mediterranea MF3/22]
MPSPLTQNDSIKACRPNPEDRLTAPASASHKSDTTRTTATAASSSSTSRSAPTSPPPSGPLPPLPTQALWSARQPTVAPTQVSTSAPRKSAGDTLNKTSTSAMGAGIPVKTSALPNSISRPKPPIGAKEEVILHETPNQATGQEFGESASASYTQTSSHSRIPEQVPAAPLPQPAKSGMFKRLATRLASTRSSPSPRPSPATTPTEEAATAKPLTTLPTQHELLTKEDVHETSLPPNSNSSLTPALTPARTSPSIPDTPTRSSQVPPPPAPQPRPRPQQTGQLQSLNARLALAVRAEKEKRAERKAEKAREEQRATDARRAAALAEVGLLPASRRYSVAPMLQNGKSFDPFAKDGIQKDGWSDEGSYAEVKEVKQEGEGGLSAAEAVIREWRVRNQCAKEVSLKEVSKGDVPQSSENNEEREETKNAKQDSTAIVSPSKKEGVSDRDAEQGTTYKPPLAPAIAASPKKEGISDGNAFSPVSTKNENPYEQNLKGDTSESKETDKAALGAWRFPVATAPSSAPASSGSTTPRRENANEHDHPVSPTSPRSVLTTSNTIKAQSNPSSPRSEDIPPPPPPKSETPKARGNTNDEKPVAAAQRSSDGREVHPAPVPLSPAQIPLPASPCSPTTPIASASFLGERARPRSATAPSMPSTPQVSISRIHSQKQQAVPPIPSQAFTLSPPALSPTTSTSASTDSGSAFPQTPTTSSHGHSPVRVLDAPLEDEEDALLSEESISSFSGANGVQEKAKSRPIVTGVKEFGELANLTSEGHNAGLALPPLPPGARAPAIGSVVTPVTVDGASDKRKRTTLFGRRRTTQNGPPMITVPGSTTSITSKANTNGIARESAKPRTVSSLTNLKRTVTSVTAGLALGSATGASTRPSNKTPSAPPPSSSFGKKTSFLGGDRGVQPVRASTMPAAVTGPGVPTTPRSNTSGANSLFPPGTEDSVQNQRSGTGVGLRVQPLNPTIHSRGSILLEAHAIEDEESRRLSELAFLD